jgi:hypothetical protein
MRDAGYEMRDNGWEMGRGRGRGGGQMGLRPVSASNGQYWRAIKASEVADKRVVYVEVGY